MNSATGAGMKNRPMLVTLGLIALMATATGCMDCQEYFAKRLLVHTAWSGRLRAAALGSEEDLLANGQIDASLRIAASDGVEIAVWLIKATGPVSPRGTVLLIHGLSDSGARMFPVAQHLAELGFDAVVPDLRAHGRSGGRYSSFGGRETPDLREVMDRLRTDGFIAGPIYVVGFSMGGGIAVQYAAGEPQCRGVVAMAPVGDVRHTMRRMLLLAAPLMDDATADGVIDRAGAIVGCDIDEISAVRAAAKLTCPILVVHGALDTVVPVGEGKAIYEAAAGPKKLEIVHWAGHTSLLMGRAAWIADKVDRMAHSEFPGGLTAQGEPALEQWFE